MDDSMIERVVRAMAAAMIEYKISPPPNSPDYAIRALARAAIAAMRGPTEKVIEAGIVWGDGEEYGGITGIEASMVWENMIEAALEESNGKA